MIKINGVIIHHSNGVVNNPLADTSHHTADVINEWHKQLWNFKSSLGWYVGYGYVVEKSGKVVKCREEWEEQAHTRGFNTGYIGICIIGNFDRAGYFMSGEQREALVDLLRDILYRHPNTPIKGHRYYSWKSCPGTHFSDRVLELLVLKALEPEEKKVLLIKKKSLLEKILGLLFRIKSLLIIRQLGGRSCSSK